MSPLVLILLQPISTATILFCSLLYLWQWNSRVDTSTIAMSYKGVVHDREVWRILSGTFSHLGVLHLAFNMTSLWNMGFIEIMGGSFLYLKYTFIFVFMDEVVGLAIVWFIAYKLHRLDYLERSAVGYSGVVFGWLAFTSVLDPYRKFTFFGLLPIPMFLSPFAYLALTQIIIRRASFIGHFSGIIVGYAIGLHLFDWFTDYFFVCAFMWVFLGMVYSLKITSAVPLPFIKLSGELSSNGISMRNGLITREISHSPRDPLLFDWSDMV